MDRTCTELADKTLRAQYFTDNKMNIKQNKLDGSHATIFMMDNFRKQKRRQLKRYFSAA